MLFFGGGGGGIGVRVFGKYFMRGKGEGEHRVEISPFEGGLFPFSQVTSEN